MVAFMVVNIRPRAVLFSLLFSLNTAACAEPPVPETPAIEIPPSASNTSKPAVLPVPMLAPLSFRPPCDIAVDIRKNADVALSKGRPYKAIRAIAQADKRCPASASTSYRTRLGALDRLGQDEGARALAKEILAAPSPEPAAAADARAALAKPLPPAPPAADVLLATALAAVKSGAADARTQLDRALIHLEQEGRTTASVFVDVGAREPLALSPDGATAVIAGGKAAILTDTKDLLPKRFFDHTQNVVGAALSLDGKFLATVDATGDAFLWSTQSGKLIRKFGWANEKIQCVAISADNKRIVTAGGNPFDAPVRVWDADTADSLETFSIKGSFEATALAISRDGKFLAVGAKLGNAELWSMNPLKQVAVLAKKESFVDSVSAIRFSPKGDKVAVVFGGGNISIWETKQGKLLVEMPDADRGAALAFSPDGLRLVGSGQSSYNPTLREWDAVTGVALQNKSTSVRVDLFSDDGKFGIGASDKGLGFLDIAKGTSVVSPASKNRRPASLIFGPPRTVAFSYDQENGVRVLSPAAGRFLPGDDDRGSLAVSLDGKLLVQSGYRSLSTWNLETGASGPVYPKFEDSVSSVAFVPQGDQLRAILSESKVFVVAVATPKQSAWTPVFQTEKKNVRSFRLSDFGPFGVFAEDKGASIANLSTGRVYSAEGTVEGGHISDAAMSGDGAVTYVAQGRKVQRFDSTTGKRTHQLPSLEWYSDDLSVSFDGSSVLVSCYEQQLFFRFSADAATPVATPLHLAPSRAKVALSPHGDLAASLAEDGILRIWTTGGTFRGEVFPMAGVDAALLRAEDGRVLLFGRDASKFEDRLFCRIGNVATPFSVCSDALTDEFLLEDVLAP